MTEHQLIVMLNKINYNLLYDCAWNYDEDIDYLAEELYEELATQLGADGYSYGASKLVFTFLNTPFVLKIPFLGTRELRYNYNEVSSLEELGYFENHYIFLEDEISFLESYYSKDYCKEDYDLYEKALKENLGDMFAKTKYLGEIRDICFYVQEKCETLASDRMESDNPAVENSKKKIERYYQNIDASISVLDFICVLSSYFIECYGEKRTQDLIEFIKKYRLDDFHGENAMFNSNGKILLVDYSGFDN